MSNKKILQITLKDLGIKKRTRKRLSLYNIETLEDLLQIDYEDLTKIRQLGIGGLKEIKGALHNAGYKIKNEDKSQDCLLYTSSSLISIFIITAIIFALLAFYGYTTKRDLTKIGTIALIALLAIIIAGILNIFIFKSTMFDTALTIIGVLIFIAYIAYDVNKVKQLMLAIGEEKAAVYGAFQLYLDFINLFIRLLELFGKRRD